MRTSLFLPTVSLVSLAEREWGKRMREHCSLVRFSIATSIILNHSRDQRRCAFFELLLVVDRFEGDEERAYLSFQ